jgi:uncharacterized protein
VPDGTYKEAMEHPDAQLIRKFYDARAGNDIEVVRSFLPDDVVWHEPGQSEFTGELRGKDAVLRMIEKAREITGGTFKLNLHDVLANDEHVVALINWTAKRGEKTIEGREAAVYHVRDGKIAEAWFLTDDSRSVNEFWA